MFTSDYLGEHVPRQRVVRFDGPPDPHPWFNWRVDARPRPLERRNHPDSENIFGQIAGPIESDQLQDTLSVHSNHLGAGGELEFDYHNGAHGHVGGWLGSGFSPADPLFFLLHNNVDRGFAHWQAKHDAWNATGMEEKSYHAVGSHPAAGATYMKGSYALDEMWPWNPGQPDWPSGFFFQMPAGVNGPTPAPIPTPASQVDYLNLAGTGVASGACYDDIGFVK